MIRELHLIEPTSAPIFLMPQSIREDRPSPPSRQDAASWALEILQRLQRTLELEDMLHQFAGHAGRLVPFDGLVYRNDEAAIQFRCGRQTRHCAAYRLDLEDESLGELSFHRARRFDETELAGLEQVLALLMYPLRNALRYHQALHSARRDGLTGLFNRTAMEELIQREIRMAQRRGDPLSMLVVDVDHFKLINDRYGHHVGDRTLRRLAELIQGCVRETDLAFRYGGEEFVVILANTGLAGARQVAERIRVGVEAQRHDLGEGADPLQVTVSIGISQLEAGDNLLSLFVRADRALYAAKEGGRNRVHGR